MGKALAFLHVTSQLSEMTNSSELLKKWEKDFSLARLLNDLVEIYQDATEEQKEALLDVISDKIEEMRWNCECDIV